MNLNVKRTNPYAILPRYATAGAAAMEDEDYFAMCVSRVVSTRERTTDALRNLGMTVLPSKTNFLFARPNALPGREVFAALRARGILVRRWDDPAISDWLRISIGTDEEMDTFLGYVKQYLAKQGS